MFLTRAIAFSIALGSNVRVSPLSLIHTYLLSEIIKNKNISTICYKQIAF